MSLRQQCRQRFGSCARAWRRGIDVKGAFCVDKLILRHFCRTQELVGRPRRRPKRPWDQGQEREPASPVDHARLAPSSQLKGLRVAFSMDFLRILRRNEAFFHRFANDFRLRGTRMAGSGHKMCRPWAPSPWPPFGPGVDGCAALAAGPETERCEEIPPISKVKAGENQ